MSGEVGTSALEQIYAVRVIRRRFTGVFLAQIEFLAGTAVLLMSTAYVYENRGGQSFGEA